MIENGKREGILTKKEGRYLLPQAPKRPIIYTWDGLLDIYVGEYIDTYLQPSVINTRSFLKDSRHLNALLKEVSYNEHTFAAININSLYTNTQQ